MYYHSISLCLKNVPDKLNVEEPGAISLGNSSL